MLEMARELILLDGMSHPEHRRAIIRMTVARA
jgi:hypothetical protein